jgi:hypothetical protein
MNIASAETAHPPLSLRDISPTRGEIVSRQDLIPSAATIFAAANQQLHWGRKALQASDLPPCGGDVAKATEGGNRPSTFTEASAA